MGRKITKKIAKVLLWTVTMFIALDFFIVSLIFIPFFQSIVVDKVMKALSDKWQSEISIGSIYITPTLTIIAKDFVIKDFKNNDMIKIDHIKTKLKYIETLRLKLAFRELYIDGAVVNLQKYRGASRVNIAIWAEHLKNKDKKEKTPFTLKADRLIMKESVFRFVNDSLRMSKENNDIDYAYFELKDIDFNATDFSVNNDDISAKISRLGFRQYTGFELQNISGNFRINSKNLIFNNCVMVTGNSRVFMDFSFIYNGFDSYGDFKNRINFYVKARPSTLNLKDLAYFVPSLKGMDNCIIFSCLAKGSLSSLNLRDLSLHYGNSTYVEGRLNIVNLVDFKNAFFNLNIKESNIKPAELAHFSLPGGKKIELPKIVNTFGEVQVNGFFKGSLTRFVTDIKMHSDLGYASGNLSVSDNVNSFIYEGSLSSNRFNLGRLTNQSENLGLISFNAKVNGSVGRKGAFLETLNANIKGKVNSFEVRGYAVNDIDLSGYYTAKKYSGKIVCADSNFAFSFDGSADFNKTIPNIQTFITIDRFSPGEMFAQHIAHLDTASSNALDKFLLYVKKHPDLNLQIDSLNLRVNGNNLEDINGIALLNGLKYRQDQKNVELNRLRLTAIANNGVHRYILTSDNLNASMATSYQINSLIDSVINIGYKYLSNLLPRREEYFTAKKATKADTTIHHQYLSLSIETYNIDPILSLLVPRISIPRNATLNFYINSQENNDSLIVNIPAILIKDSTNNEKIKISSLSVAGNESSKESFRIQLKSDTFAIVQPNNDLLFRDIYMVANVDNELIEYNLVWSNPELISTQPSQLSGIINAKNQQDITARVTKSSIFIKNYEWKFDTLHTIHMRGNEFDFNNVKIAARQSRINLNGTLSKKSTDTLTLDLMNVDLSQLNPYTETKKMSFAGDISSKIRLFYRNGHRILFGRLLISDFAFNDEYFGNIFLRAAIPSTGNIRLRGGIFVSDDKINSNIIETFNVEAFNAQPNRVADLDGSFNTEDNSLVVTADIDSLRIGFLSPFLSSFSQYVDGKASGKLSFISKKDSTYFKGKIDIQDAALGIKPLNTIYRIEKQAIEFTRDGFNFNKIILNDKFNNTAVLDGYVHHRNFKEFTIDLSIETSRILALNTQKSTDNPFYGDGFVSGRIHILGDTKKLSFVGNDIRTEPGSKLYLPLTFEDKVTDSEIITFKTDTVKTVKIKRDSVETSTTDMDFDFTFSVTPDLAVQIDLDPSIGGTLQGVTEGILRIIYSTGSDLELIGNLTLRSGTFSMAFKDILNKRFSLSPGGTINFSGPIQNATVDLSAIYKTTASLAEVFSSEGTTSSARRVPVNAYINLKNSLMNPDIGFSFELPNSTNDLRTKFYSAIDTTNAQNNIKQFFSLVMFGKFESANNDGNNTLISGAEYTGIELLTNTLNNFISQQLKNVDIGFNYRNRDATHSEEYSVYATTSFYNNRIIIEGNFGYVNDPDNNYGNATNFIGDGSIEYLLNEAGNWRVKVFNVTNQYYSLTNTSPYAQGVALIYKQEFNNGKDILETFKRKKKKKEKEEKPISIIPKDSTRNE